MTEYWCSYQCWVRPSHGFSMMELRVFPDGYWDWSSRWSGVPDQDTCWRQQGTHGSPQRIVFSICGGGLVPTRKSSFIPTLEVQHAFFWRLYSPYLISFIMLYFASCVFRLLFLCSLLELLRRKVSSFLGLPSLFHVVDIFDSCCTNLRGICLQV